MKVTIPAKIIVDFDENIPGSMYDDLLRDYFKSLGLDFAYPFGHNEYSLIVGVKIVDK